MKQVFSTTKLNYKLIMYPHIYRAYLIFVNFIVPCIA
jgi:hypothetical protein